MQTLLLPRLGVPLHEWTALTHKERRRLVSKTRKRRKRVLLAWAEQEELAEGTEDELTEREREIQEERARQKEEAERALRHEAWVEREKKAQVEFILLKEKEERKKREREERERLIREEWEALERREKEEEERKNRALKEKEELLEEALSSIDLSLQSAGHKPEPWHNPLAPTNSDDSKQPANSEQNHDNYGTEKDVVNCPFYLKTGACRFGDRCSRQHPAFTSGNVLLLQGMYNYMGLSEQLADEYDQDVGLEHDEADMYEHFKEFCEDVLPEFSLCGTVVQFKVCRNHEPHLRGNVYVQYSSEEECDRAMQKFSGRWYASRQLSCRYCRIEKWKNAICGLYDRQKCPKGKRCNFLHVFKNPGGAFSWYDLDLTTPTHPNNTPRRESLSSRGHARDWDSHHRHRPRSRSRERCHSSRKRRRRSRSHSRDRHRSRSRDRRWSWNRHQSRSRDRNRSRSRDRNWSQSKDRNRLLSRYGNRSPSQDRNWPHSQEENRSWNWDGNQSCGPESEAAHVGDQGKNGSKSCSQENSPSPTGSQHHKKKKKHSSSSRHSKKSKKHKHHSCHRSKPDKENEPSPLKKTSAEVQPSTSTEKVVCVDDGSIDIPNDTVPSNKACSKEQDL